MRRSAESSREFLLAPTKSQHGRSSTVSRARTISQALTAVNQTIQGQRNDRWRDYTAGVIAVPNSFGAAARLLASVALTLVVALPAVSVSAAELRVIAGAEFNPAFPDPRQTNQSPETTSPGPSLSESRSVPHGDYASVTVTFGTALVNGSASAGSNDGASSGATGTWVDEITITAPGVSAGTSGKDSLVLDFS